MNITNLPTKDHYVLSLDGGSVRTIMQVVWLKELSKRYNERIGQFPLSVAFDYIGGTSMGGIIALGFLQIYH